MQQINLNLIPGGVMPVVNVSQYDVGRQFRASIYEGSASYSLTGKSIVIQGTKSDNKGVAYDATAKVNGVSVVSVSGNIVTVTTTSQMTAVAGKEVMEFLIRDGSGNSIGTLNFVLLVEPSALADGIDRSDTELPAYLDGAQKSAREAAASASEASDAAQTATAAAQSAASSAASAGDSAQSALASKDAAERAAETSVKATTHTPYISETTGNWMIYNVTDEVYEDSGVDASITVQIADITMLDPSDSPSVTNTGTSTDPVFHLFIPMGSGIKTIIKSGTEGLIDTYTITCSDGYSFDYYVTNGKSAYQSAVEGGYAGSEAQFESDIANMETWAEMASDSATLAESWAVGSTGTRSGEDANNARYWSQISLQQSQEAQRQADIVTQYAGFVTPHYIMQDNRLYVQDAAAPQWTVANNRLYIKLAG